MMPFVDIGGFPGKVYVPETPPASQKKNPCPDCFFCQICSDDRCQVCRNKRHPTGTGLCVCNDSNPEKHPKNEKSTV
ncbi:MAG: hypothetical protein COX19_01530 [Desulfobacterales bacterium CG23_combo_of_CG06-09_8_20_14_all_51_8]|nr:MAG: hypothetical protein COX19_01530 [Desulfobacterales bacterium CG23_combo_of_CG06-09_8_20_14_all_51_8]